MGPYPDDEAGRYERQHGQQQAVARITMAERVSMAEKRLAALEEDMGRLRQMSQALLAELGL